MTISVILQVMLPNTHAQTLAALQAHLPMRVGQWAAQVDDRIYDQHTIFGYINGAAEVYRAYNLQQCLSRRYTISGGPAIILDIFDMGSSEDAYGVFTHDIDGAKVSVGSGGRLRAGWLGFWKSRFFVSIYAEEETTAATSAVVALSHQIANKITGDNTLPAILSQLPSSGLQRDRIRYLHHPIVLNYHYYISDENILNISSETDVALAEYRIDNQMARMLLVKYPTVEKAGRSQARFLKHYLADADPDGTALLENGKWAAINRREDLLAIVLEADNRRLAIRLLRDVE
jgi:hypothetical protein